MNLRNVHVCKTPITRHEKLFPELLHSKFSASWFVYVNSARRCVSVVEIDASHQPGRISSGEDEIIVVGPNNKLYIINAFIGNSKERRSFVTAKKIPAASDNQAGLGLNVLLACAGSVITIT